MTLTDCTPRGVTRMPATDGPRKRSEPVIAEPVRALPLKCGTKIGGLTLRMSATHAHAPTWHLISFVALDAVVRRHF